MALNDYAHVLPDPGQIQLRLKQAVECWQDRDKIIRDLRAAEKGENPIQAPKATQYRVVVVHAYSLAAAINEKTARFLSKPEIAVIPNGTGQKARSEATELQNGINRVFEVMEEHSDGDTWSRALRDAILLDGGVERIERAPAAFWPEIAVFDDEGKNKFQYIFQDPEAYEEAKENYKKQAGPPIRSLYVPLECFKPIYEGATPVETFEIERRSLRSVMGNPMFNKEGLSRFIDKTGDGGLSTYVTVIHYMNQKHHAYYALVPSTSYSRPRWPDASTITPSSLGTPVFLAAYPHGLNRPLYNILGGRFGGWKGPHNEIEGVGRALLDINQDLDDIASQVATHIRNTNWNQYVAYYDQSLRGGDEQVPQPPVIQEGQNIGMWKGEELVPLVEPRLNPEVQWFWGVLTERIQQLAGSTSVFGQHQPGVSTGYHEALQIAQAEHLDNKIEEHLARGAVGRATLVLEHCVAGGEKWYVFHSYKDGRGRLNGKYITLDPDKLVPLPRMSARVRAPKPQDTSLALQAMLQATAPRGNGRPLMDDDTALSTYGGFEAPDEIRRKVDEQMERERLIASGVLSQLIAQRLNMLIVRNQAPPITGEMAAQADPALLAAAQQINEGGETLGMGGVAPQTALAQADARAEQGIHPLNGLGGGLPAGAPQPNQTLARGLQVMQGAG